MGWLKGLSVSHQGLTQPFAQWLHNWSRRLVCAEINSYAKGSLSGTTVLWPCLWSHLCWIQFFCQSPQRLNKICLQFLLPEAMGKLLPFWRDGSIRCKTEMQRSCMSCGKDGSEGGETSAGEGFVAPASMERIISNFNTSNPFFCGDRLRLSQNTRIKSNCVEFRSSQYSQPSAWEMLAKMALFRARELQNLKPAPNKGLHPKCTWGNEGPKEDCSVIFSCSCWETASSAMRGPWVYICMTLLHFSTDSPCSWWENQLYLSH